MTERQLECETSRSTRNYSYNDGRETRPAMSRARGMTGSIWARDLLVSYAYADLEL